MICIYILKSDKGNYYVGSTNNLDRRIEEHKKGFGCKTTKKGKWELFMYKECVSISEARIEEKKVKSYKGGNAFKKIIHGELAEWSKAPHC